MSAVIVLTPVVVAAWPVVAGAVLAAAHALGYSVLRGKAAPPVKVADTVEVEVPNSEVVGEDLGREGTLVLRKEDVTVTFRTDARGRLAVEVTGKGRSHDDLRAIGAEVAQRVTRQFVYEKVKRELAARQFQLVEEEVGQDQSIHIRVRRWSG